MAVRVLAWRYDHVGDCNRYGNCVDHPYFERPEIGELAEFPQRLPNGASRLEYAPSDAVTRDGVPEDVSASGYASLRNSADALRAAVGEALHRMQRGHAEEVRGILDSAASAYDHAKL